MLPFMADCTRSMCFRRQTGVFAFKRHGHLLRMLSSSLEGSFKAQRAAGCGSRALSPLPWPPGTMQSLPKSHNRALNLQEKNPQGSSAMWSWESGQWHPALGGPRVCRGGCGGICSAARPTPEGSFFLGGGLQQWFYFAGSCHWSDLLRWWERREVQGTHPRGVTSCSPPQPCCWLSLHRAEHPWGRCCRSLGAALHQPPPNSCSVVPRPSPHVGVAQQHLVCPPNCHPMPGGLTKQGALPPQILPSASAQLMEVIFTSFHLENHR